MTEERFSIGELAIAAATTPRTIRFYATEGLLPPPLTEGRNAIYTQVHRRRLRLIQRLKAAYLPLSAIKEQMVGLTDDQVDALLERSGPHRVENTGPPHPPKLQATATEPESSNVAYVAQILAAAEQVLAGVPSSDGPPHSKRVLIVSPLLKQKDDSAAVANGQEPPELADLGRWVRIGVLPGIELNVSESVAESHRVELTRLIRFARALFTDQDA